MLSSHVLVLTNACVAPKFEGMDMIVGALSLQSRWKVYECAVRVAWADGRLSAEEVQLGRILAEELGLDGPTSLAGAVLRAGHSDLPVDIEPQIAGLAYAAAVWMAYADGFLHRRESIVLRNLRARLELDEFDLEFDSHAPRSPEQLRRLVRRTVRSSLLPPPVLPALPEETAVAAH